VNHSRAKGCYVLERKWVPNAKGDCRSWKYTSLLPGRAQALQQATVVKVAIPLSVVDSWIDTCRWCNCYAKEFQIDRGAKI
jgi:hypothetical protein